MLAVGWSGLIEDVPTAGPEDDRVRQRLTADCTRCFGLCCVASAFSVSADFAIDKPAGTPCPNLRTDFRCDIHAQLRQRGFAGCTAYDCFGAGQTVSQVTFGGQDWRRRPHIAAQMFEALIVMRQLHELLWYLSAALGLSAARGLHPRLRLAFEATERLTHSSPEALLALDVGAHRSEVNGLLQRASELARAGLRGRNLRGADLIGKSFKRADLRGANLRGAQLIGADLAGADLDLADVTGADLRGADLSGARLGRCLFLTQSQLKAARGDAATRLPDAFSRPAHWAAGQ
jgi:uncharacterized protein YjbI with pentapeptide repeats